MRTLFIAMSLLISSSAFSMGTKGQEGEVSRTSGSTHACCPTGGCEDKNLPVCAAVVQREQSPKLNPGSQRTTPRKKGSKVDEI